MANITCDPLAANWHNLNSSSSSSYCVVPNATSTPSLSHALSDPVLDTSSSAHLSSVGGSLPFNSQAGLHHFNADESSQLMEYWANGLRTHLPRLRYLVYGFTPSDAAQYKGVDEVPDFFLQVINPFDQFYRSILLINRWSHSFRHTF